MGTDIANRVQKQVDEQLKQLGIAPSARTGANHISSNPCGQIARACKDAGFAKSTRNSDCVYPLMQGKPQPETATITLPQVDPQVIAACKKIDRNYGHSKNDEGASSSPDTDSDTE